MTLTPDYVDFWVKVAMMLSVIGLVAVIAGIVIPLYGIWYEMHRDNDYMDSISKEPVVDEPADIWEMWDRQNEV